MKPGIVYIWSSGFEKWEETGITYSGTISIKEFKLANIKEHLQTKNVGSGIMHIYHDTLDRYVAIYYQR